MEFIDKLLSNKKVSVWGGGYLGYTYALRLQSAGFVVNLFDFGGNRVSGRKDGSFPNQAQKESWSAMGKLPLLNFSKLNVCSEISQMFESELHIISFPAIRTRERNLLTELKRIMIDNMDRLGDPLFLFQSAEIPRTIENSFIRELKKEGLYWSYASAFRSDWTVEEFLTDSNIQVISGYDEESLEKAKAFFDLLEINYEVLSSIEEAEIYENALNAVSLTLSAFLNQLLLSYPAIDIRKMTKLLLKNIGEKNDLLNIGTMQYKVANSIDHLVSGVKGNNYLSILRDAESGNISILFKYADLIKEKGVKKVCIFGISSKNTFKDIRFSPSVILAEYLNKCGITVFIDDPHYTKDEIATIFPYAKYFNIDSDIMDAEALFVFRKHSEYRYFSQNDIDEKGISKTKIIIDDVGIFKYYKFSEKTLYHIPGDGNLSELY